MDRSNLSNNLVAIGDSHIDMLAFFCRATCRVPGASAYGLTSDQSETRARQAFKGFLSAFDDCIPLICVGEVDCNSLAWHNVSEVKPEDFIKLSIAHLSCFLLGFKRKFIISSVILPPVESYIGLPIRQTVSATKQQRTDLVKLFNIRLENVANSLGHYYLDITNPTMGSDGFVDKKYVISPKDVHLSPIKVYDIVRKSLNSAESRVMRANN